MLLIKIISFNNTCVNNEQFSKTLSSTEMTDVGIDIISSDLHHSNALFPMRFTDDSILKINKKLFFTLYYFSKVEF